MTGELTPLVRALGVAHHWQRLLQSGRYDSLSDIAAAEGMDLGQASRILRLTQLAPEVIEVAMAEGQLKAGLSEVLKGFSDEWGVQQGRLVASAVIASALSGAPE